MTDRKFRVVMVDDDFEDIFTFRKSFTEATSRIDFVAYGNGDDLFEILEDSDSPTVDLILLDLNMPNMNGYEVLEKLQANIKWKSIPVYILTTSDLEIDRKRSINAGARKFVTKPTSLGTLFELTKFIENQLILQCIGNSANADG